jgi:hypothetical protein
MSTNNASLNYTASRHNKKWCAIHHFNTNERTEFRRNQSLKENLFTHDDLFKIQTLFVVKRLSECNYV